MTKFQRTSCLQSQINLKKITDCSWHPFHVFNRVPTLLVTKKFQDFSRTTKAFFQDPVTSQQCLNTETNSSYYHICNMIAAFIQEYAFITVTCCKEIAKKLFVHFLTIIYTWCSIYTSYCRKKSRSFSAPAACCPAAELQLSALYLHGASMPRKFHDSAGPCT